MSRLEMILLCLCMGACTGTPAIDPLEYAGLSRSGFDLVETEKQFRERVVGQSLSGSGYRAEVLPGGTLTGLYVGEVFNGVWVFTEDGRYCQSLTATLTGPTSACYWVAVKDDDVRLIPVPAGI